MSRGRSGMGPCVESGGSEGRVGWCTKWECRDMPVVRYVWLSKKLFLLLVCVFFSILSKVFFVFWFCVCLLFLECFKPYV